MMIPTKLILIEGLPGSGKTTLAQFLSGALDRKQIPCRCLLEESTPHPLHAPWYDDPELFAAASIKTWQTFLQKTYPLTTVTIAESSLFQGTSRLLLQQDMPLAGIKAYVDHVQITIKALNPILIYLKQKDVESAIKRICQIRGAQWQNYLVTAVTENPYGRRRKLKGFPGAVAFMESYNELCNCLLSRLDLPQKVIVNPVGNWERSYQEIVKFLGLD